MAPDVVLDAEPVDAGERLVDAHELQLAVEKPQADGRILVERLDLAETRPRLALAAAKILLELLTRRNVHLDAGNAERRALVVAHGLAAGQDPAHAAIGKDGAELRFVRPGLRHQPAMILGDA